MKQTTWPVVVVVVACVAASLSMGCASAPRGTPGPAAEELATAIETATGQQAWKDVGVVSFTFRGGRSWLWDRTRGLVRLVDDQGTVLIDTWDRGGFVIDSDGHDVDVSQSQGRLQDAWSGFINDTFWLNPMATFRNNGAQRELVNFDGHRALVLRYDNGGVTPGDTYLFFVDDNGLPTRWKMWVQALPVRGFETTFEEWVDVGGARLASMHRGPAGSTMSTAPIRGGKSLQDVGVDVDPFDRLLARRH